MFPAEWGQVLQQVLVHGLAVIPDRLFLHYLDRSVQIDGVPEYDCGGYEIEAARPVALVLVTAVSHLAQPVFLSRDGEPGGNGERTDGGAHPCGP